MTGTNSTPPTFTFDPNRSIYQNIDARKIITIVLEQLVDDNTETFPDDPEVNQLAPSLEGLIMDQIEKDAHPPCDHVYAHMETIAHDILTLLPEGEQAALQGAMEKGMETGTATATTTTTGDQTLDERIRSFSTQHLAEIRDRMKQQNNNSLLQELTATRKLLGMPPNQHSQPEMQGTHPLEELKMLRNAVETAHELNALRNKMSIIEELKALRTRMTMTEELDALRARGRIPRWRL